MNEFNSKPYDKNEIVYVYRRKRTIGNLIDDFIDRWISRRLARNSYEFDSLRKSKIAVFANDFIGNQIIQHGFFEKRALDMIFSFLAPVLQDIESATALDVGANIGNHSLYFSRYFSSVHAFEPHPRAYALLAFNSQEISNIDVFNFGLGDSQGLVELNENWTNMGSASMKYVWTKSPSRVAVKVALLDDVCVDLDKIAFLKIDVEGFEPNVLRGARKTIKKHQPLILIEQLQTDFVNGSSESIDILLREGYLFCWHESWASSHGFVRHRINTFCNLLLGRSYDYNFFCGKWPPAASYEMLIAVPRRFQNQLFCR